MILTYTTIKAYEGKKPELEYFASSVKQLHYHAEAFCSFLRSGWGRWGDVRAARLNLSKRIPNSQVDRIESAADDIALTLDATERRVDQIHSSCNSSTRIDEKFTRMQRKGSAGGLIPRETTNNCLSSSPFILTSRTITMNNFINLLC